jgi:hypothetical protein
MVTAAERCPAEIGANVTLIVQKDPASTLVPQSFICEKSPLLRPVTPIPLIVSVPVPVFVSFTLCAALVVPMFWPANVKLATLKLAAGAVPVPVRLTDCWLLAMFPALSVIVNEAVRAPETVGVKVTLVVQFAPAARLTPQLFVSAKSPALAPVIPIELIERATPPLFVSVTPWRLLVVPVFCPAKVKLATVKLAPGTAPVPVKLTDCWLLAMLPASSVMVTEAVRVPDAVGVNVTLIAQFVPAARLVPQLFDCEKSPALVPVMPMEAIERVVPPLFVSVTVCGLLADPMPWPAKVKLATLKPAPGTAPVPVRLTACLLLATFPALSVIVTEAVRIPDAEGVNVTLMVQLVPAATLVPQLFDSEKSVLSTPVTAIEATARAAPPLFVNVTGCAVLVVPTGVLANVSEPTESDAEGVIAFTVSEKTGDELAAKLVSPL